jgi:hypothetical protein
MSETEFPPFRIEVDGKVEVPSIHTKADAIGQLGRVARQYPGRNVRALDRFDDEVGAAKVDPAEGRPS